MRILLMLVPLWSGCLVTDKMVRELVDTDGDGFTEIGFHGDELQGGQWPNGTDCDDEDPDIHPEAVEVCMDAKDNDCDGLIDEDGHGDVLVFHDVDEDGFGNAYDSRSMCTPNEEWVINAGDCDDRNSYINPFMLEACDGLDNDCDGEFDDNAPHTPWYRDADGDSFGTVADVVLSCQPPDGYVPSPDDCDDTDAAAFPGADDAAYDGIDADCARDSDYDLDGDGFFHAASGATPADCDDVQATIRPGAPEVWYDGIDQDCDPSTEWDQDRDGFDAMPGGTDCDDTTALRRPGASEVWYDNIDQDCDPNTEWDQDADGITAPRAPVGTADDCDDQAVQVGSPTPWYRDADGDGWGESAGGVVQCVAPPGHVARSGDCQDTLYLVNPGVEERCSIWDDDCDGINNEDAGTPWYPDLDRDGFGDANAVAIQQCDPPAGFAATASDCDDTRADVGPRAPEVCDGVDNDCDGDPDVIGGRDLRVDLYRDNDRDGWGDPAQRFHGCVGLRQGWITQAGDCDDDNDAVFPHAAEPCDGVDNNCQDDLNDEGRETRWRDDDGDGWGAGPSEWQCSTWFGPGWVLVDGDCDDTSNTIRPGAAEVCDYVDNDCDGGIDFARDGRDLRVNQWPDDDGDGFGANDPARQQLQCEDTAGWSPRPTDCDDFEAAFHPGAEEVCDALDQDCDGDARDDGRTVWWSDFDGDGWGGDPADFCPGISPDPLTWVQRRGDCDDESAEVSPGATEICDEARRDHDCDPATPEPMVGQRPDLDGDGYGSANTSTEPHCRGTAGWSELTGDCQDDPTVAGAAQVHPNASELCDDVDQDCDGTVADDGRETWYHDHDDDGWGREGLGSPQTICRSLLPRPQEWIRRGDDCDDQDALVHPGAAEVCDEPAVDNDCNRATPEPMVLQRPDHDGDGHGDRFASSESHCPGLAGWSELTDDCEDDPLVAGSSGIYGGAPELCDEVDQDCDGRVEDDGRETWYHDFDDDGWGRDHTGSPRTVCWSLLPNRWEWVRRGGDCDDQNAAINPNVREVCDEGGLDNDCNPNTVDGLEERWPDRDDDGFGDRDLPSGELHCPSLPGWSDDPRDCDDRDARIRPGAADTCGGVDQDCDDDLWEGGGVVAWWDGDGDGQGEIGLPEQVCLADLCLPGEAGCHVLESGDCDEGDAQTYEGASEVCDGKDNDCDPCTPLDQYGDGNPNNDVGRSDVCGAGRFEWGGSVYLVSDTDMDRDAADRWCDGKGYGLWKPNEKVRYVGLQYLWLEREWREFWQLGYVLPGFYHTAIEWGRCTGAAANDWNYVIGEACTEVPDHVVTELGLTGGIPDYVIHADYAHAGGGGFRPEFVLEGRDNDARALCELDGDDLVPSENPTCP